VALFISALAVRADVLDQVPGDALVVLKIKDLDGASRKIAGWAKTIGIDQQDPAWADPLGAIADKTHLGKGVKRDGDLAIAMLDPAKVGSTERDHRRDCARHQLQELRLQFQGDRRRR